MIPVPNQFFLNQRYHPSKIHVDVNVLLALRNNFKFFLSLQVGQLNDRLANNSQRISDLLLTDDKRRRKSNDVLVSGFGLLRNEYLSQNLADLTHQ
jgi:hypothetical protein